MAAGAMGSHVSELAAPFPLQLALVLAIGWSAALLALQLTRATDGAGGSASAAPLAFGVTILGIALWASGHCLVTIFGGGEAVQPVHVGALLLLPCIAWSALSLLSARARRPALLGAGAIACAALLAGIGWSWLRTLAAIDAGVKPALPLVGTAFAVQLGVTAALAGWHRAVRLTSVH